jgi:pimeloyl-ACP methyl ester carboxylesterase
MVDRKVAARRVSWVGRRLDPYREYADGGIVMPPLPSGEAVLLPGRGEMFFRHIDGPGVPVLLLHGWMAGADLNWFRVYGPLGERHAVIAPDQRGHGRGIRSPSAFSLEDCADDAAELLVQLGIPKAVVVGYSLGGPVASLLWRRHPELVAGLVLEATAMEWNFSWRERVVWRLMGLLGVMLRWPTGRIALLRMMGGLEDVPADLLSFRQWADGEFRRNDPMEMAEAGRALGHYDARSFAGSIDVPTAVVVTTKDRLVPPDRQLALAAVARAEVFEFAGDHGAVAMQPETFAAVTLEAIAWVTREVARPRAE